MKILRPFLFALAATVATSVAAQELKPCSQWEQQQKLYEEHPEMEAEWEAYHKEMLKQAKAMMKDGRVNTKAVKYTIPVVFHVFHEPNDDRSDISEEQIKDAVKLTNLNFAGKSLTVNEVIPEFKPIIADVEVEIKIATKDPNGNCTNGIIRYEQALPDGGTDQEYKAGRQWPTNKYLNVYIVPKIASGAAGYAYYPANGNEARDGVVLLYNYTGSIERSTYNRAFTLAHEVGHYLNLPHTWGNSNNTNLASNCNVDDGIEDTPNTQGSNSCNVGRETCGSLDNVQNFMDYSYCSHMFTEGQKAVVHAALNNFTAGRNNLHTQANLEATGVTYDATVGPDFLCEAAFKTIGKTTICPGESVEFEDMSYFNVTGWEWTFEGGTPATSTEQNPTVTYNNPGEYDVTLKVFKGNETTSVTRAATVFVLDDTQLTLPYEEEFLDPAIIETGGNFSVYNEDQGITWDLTEPTGYEDQTSCYVRARNMSSSVTVDELISVPFSLSGLSSPKLSFAYAHALRALTNNDQLVISVSADCGETYTSIKSIVRNSLATAPVTPTAEFAPKDQSEWKISELDLSDYVGQVIQFKFSYVHGGGNNMYIDRIRVQESTTGISEAELLNSFSVYPNPNNGEVSLSFENINSVESVSIISTVGQKVYSTQDLAPEMNINLNSKLTNGVYFVRVESKNGNYAVRKMTVVK